MPALLAARADVDRAERQASQLADQRVAVQRDLDRLAGEIARRKASLPAGAEPTQDLLELLQRSTLLAQQIEVLERHHAEADAEAREARRRLAEVCTKQAKELEQWSDPGQTEAEARASLRASLTELEKRCSPAPVAGDEPSGRVGVPAATLEAGPSDDAQRLRQKADFLRDREDRLRRQVAMLDQRIEALSRERVLQHRVSEFLQESSLFDEDDRRVARSELLVPAGRTTAVEPSPSTGGGANNSPGPALSAMAPASAAQTATSTSPKASDSTSTASTAQPVSATASALQRTGDSALEGVPAGSEDSIEALSARRAILAAEADRLHIAALALEHASGPR